MVLSAPIYVHWEITDCCNLKCRHCYQQHSKELLKRDSKTLFYIADQLIEEKVFQVTLTGGEPLLVAELPELVMYLSKNNIVPRITTNGFFINHKWIDILKQYNVKIQISLDSSDEMEHNFIRNNELAFKKAINAIKLLVENECDVSIGFCANKLNYHRIEEIISLALKMGVNSVLVGEMVPNNVNNRKLFFSKYDYKMFIESASKLKQLYHERIQLSIDTEWGFLLDDNMEHAPCSALDRDMAILANGDVVPCPFIRHSAYVLGNVFKEKIKTIWNSEKAAYFRNNKYRGCNSACKYYKKCMSGCKAMLANEGKIIEEVDINAPCIKWELLQTK